MKLNKILIPALTLALVAISGVSAFAASPTARNLFTMPLSGAVIEVSEGTFDFTDLEIVPLELGAETLMFTIDGIDGELDAFEFPVITIDVFELPEGTVDFQLGEGVEVITVNLPVFAE